MCKVNKSKKKIKGNFYNGTNKNENKFIENLMI